MNLKDRIYTECTTVGTGNIQVGGIKNGFQDWSVLDDGDDVYYCIIDDLAWEVGQGVYIKDVNEVTRDKVFDSSTITNSKLVLDGLSTVFATYPADKAVIQDINGHVILPEAVIQADTLNADRVNTPVIFTSAVLVDDDGDDEGIATALNVYTKPEVDELQRVQDLEINENAKDIIALEEELEAVVPAFDRGTWTHDAEATDLNSAPLASCYFIKDVAGGHAETYADTKQIYFNNIDSQTPPATHTFADVKVGQNVELFESLDSSFLLANITGMVKEDDYTKFIVDVLKSEGRPSFEVGAGGDIGVDTTTGKSLDAGVRVKFFDLGGEVSLDGFMPKAGGTFTGEVKHKKDIIIEPTLPSRFVTIKNRYATNADGSDAGAGGTGFGVNFDLDHGNSGYNQVKFTNRSGNILAVNGGTGPSAKYYGRMTDNNHLVTKLYVDNSALHTLHSGGNTFKFNSSSNAPNDNYFTTVSSLTSSNKEWHFKNLWSPNGGSVLCKDYEATTGSILEIWEGTKLLVKTSIKDWKTSTRGNTAMMFNCAGYKPTVYDAVYLDTAKVYSIFLTNMKKK
jgi:hypothetical protein